MARYFDRHLVVIAIITFQGIWVIDLGICDDPNYTCCVRRLVTNPF
jgi:hypothetical protein